MYSKSEDCHSCRKVRRQKKKPVGKQKEESKKIEEEEEKVVCTLNKVSEQNASLLFYFLRTLAAVLVRIRSYIPVYL